MNRYFHRLLEKYFAYHIRPGDSFIDVNPLDDHLRRNLKNVHNSLLIIDTANLHADPDQSVPSSFSLPDYLVLNGTIHYERDIQRLLQRLHRYSTPETRLLIAHYSGLWRPVLRLATFFGLRRKSPETNWITTGDLANLLRLSGFELIHSQSRCLMPIGIPFISNLVNSYISPLPLINHFNLFHIATARPIFSNRHAKRPGVSVVIPARNEEENIARIVDRIPRFSNDDELIFVEGGSTDQTWERLQEIDKRYGSEWSIRIVRQDGKGKGDAVRKGFSLATREILMILDADMTVAPEDLPRFYEAIVNDTGEFINGSRLVYPMERGAMRFLNMVGNKFFAMAFSGVLGQTLKDTLCGTKVLSRSAYLKIARNRTFFGDFDPFGDFDLIFGASRMGLKIIEVPIVYRERAYGTTNISRWRHGSILLRMLFFAIRKIKLY